MNKEVIKAMNKKEAVISRFGKWWNKNGYKVMRIIFFPVWGCVCAKSKIEKYLNSKCEWSEERVNRILSYYIPRKAEWDKNEKCFYFTDNSMIWGTSYDKKFIKFHDRRWWSHNRSFWGDKIKTYLIEEFEIEGFRKEVGDTCDQWTEIAFYLIEK